MVRFAQFAFFLLSFHAAQAASPSDAVIQAIFDNDVPHLKRYLAGGGDANARGSRDNTLLMYATAYGTRETMKLLLDRGANPNLKNAFGATALMWSISDADKVRLLLSKGADVNAQSRSKRTALLLAALQPEGAKSVKILVAHGANPATKDEFGYTIVSAGAASGNAAAVRLGLSAQVDLEARTRIGWTALTSAANNGSVEITKLLLDAGADANTITSPAGPKVKNGTVTTGHFTPLILAAPYASSALTRILLDHGAKVQARDDRGMTALDAAVASESANVETVRLLLAKGADPALRNGRGESTQDWARKFPRPEVMAMVGVTAPVTLAASGAGNLSAREAYTRSMVLLEKVSGSFLREGGCIACHAQNITALAAGAGRASGLRIDAKAAQQRMQETRLNWTSQAEGLLIREDGPGAAANVAASLLGLAADGYKPDLVTAAMARNCAVQQQADGAWRRPLSLSRVPSEDSAIALTAEVVRALSLFGGEGTRAEYNKRIARARRWLLKATPTYTVDANFRLLGLKWSGAAGSEVAKAAKVVVASQRTSGGWGQRENLPEDAYATGQALAALHEAGMAADHPVFRHGVAYLLRTQAADGSWHVVSRSVKFQPYFQSGFPYDQDQWISMAGTAWATSAVAVTAGAEKAETLTAAVR